MDENQVYNNANEMLQKNSEKFSTLLVLFDQYFDIYLNVRDNQIAFGAEDEALKKAGDNVKDVFGLLKTCMENICKCVTVMQEISKKQKQQITKTYTFEQIDNSRTLSKQIMDLNKRINKAQQIKTEFLSYMSRLQFALKPVLNGEDFCFDNLNDYAAAFEDYEQTLDEQENDLNNDFS